MPTFSAQHALGQTGRDALFPGGDFAFGDPAGSACQCWIDPLASSRLISLLYQRGEFDERAVANRFMGFALVCGRHGWTFDHGNFDPRLLCPARYKNTCHHRHDCDGIERRFQYCVLKII